MIYSLWLKKQLWRVNMDNFKLVPMGVEMASEILGIKMPKVHFFMDQEVHYEGINAVYIKEDNIINFNRIWLYSIDNLEVMATCFLQARHAFQHEVINSTYKGDLKTSQETIDLWTKESNNFKSTIKYNNDEYLMQDLVIDAVAFSHLMMLKYFEVKTVIPEEIKDQVNIKLAELEQSNFKIYQINDDKK